MTRINRLVIKGFKSFAKHTEIAFGERFNCVLGPNGAGKSNVLDALCFVLGKSSSKALRAEKSANLIYNGGKTKKAAKEAEVSIYFDNSDKTFPSDEPEVKITRIVRQTGQSIYKINDEKRTRHEVVELLLMANIDAEGYNVILQGDIVRFVEMSPVERRLLIDDISGISKYEEKRNVAIRNLERVDEKIKEAEIILQEREIRLKELKKERDQAAKYKDLHEKIDRNKATYLFRQIEHKQKLRDDSYKAVEKYKEKLKQIQAIIDKNKDLISKKKENISHINKEIEEKGEVGQVSLQKEIEQLKVDIAKSENRIDSCNEELRRIDERKNQLSKSIDDINEKISRLKKEKSELERTLKSNKKQDDLINDRIAKFKKKNDLESAYGFEKRIEEIDSLLETKEKDIQQLRFEQQELLRKKDKIEFSIEKIDEQIEKILVLKKENKEQLDNLKNMKKEFKNVTKDLNKLIDKSASYSARLSDARKRLLKADEELAKINARNAGVQEHISSDLALRKILDSDIKGIYGTVASLGQVDSKFSTALEIAAGGKIKSVVVKDDKVAAACIKFLKKNRYGVATFLPMNKIRPKPLTKDTFKNTSGVYGRAIDLVTYDDKFKDIFSYVFGSTIVVENVDVARRIGIGVAKMVTLDGDLAQMSGAMQGGYRKKAGRMSFIQKELMQDMQKYEKQKTESQEIVSALERKKSESEEEIARLREFKANLEGDIIKLEKSLHLDSDDTDADKDLKKRSKEELRLVDKEIMESNLKISTLNQELAKFKIEKQTLRQKITQLRNPVLVAELNAFEQKKSELHEKNLEIKNDIKNIDSQMDNILLPELNNLERVLKQMDGEHNKFSSEIKDLRSSISSMSKDLLTKEKKQKAFYEKFKDLFSKRSKIDEEINKLSTKIDISNNQMNEFDKKIAVILSQNTQFDAELQTLNEEFKQYDGVKLLKDKPEAELKKEISQFENMVSNLGSVNMRALEIYDSVESEYKSMLEKKEKLRIEREDVLVLIDEIDSKKKDLFFKTYNNIEDHFKEIFSSLSSKGEALLELENPDSPFEGGVRIKVRLTSNKYLDIRSLSGGEKTLTALAFIFCIQEYEPASFYVLDEVDAALDKKNAEKLANLIKKYGDRAQYIIISHNDAVISEADFLFGVSMNEHGQSNVVSLKL